eukprot:TRINITY_DN14145_c0_g1_i1.p1 TRINITY_DN14145_c0_g1~~TRINITY_DN14145_c0_g1_i1.p1  ORF type:complete len:114 (+),score=0.19 TRINITY_DN14145_c0_g1_i1:226-567(+)
MNLRHQVFGMLNLNLRLTCIGIELKFSEAFIMKPPPCNCVSIICSDCAVSLSSKRLLESTPFGADKDSCSINFVVSLIKVFAQQSIQCINEVSVRIQNEKSAHSYSRRNHVIS